MNEAIWNRFSDKSRKAFYRAQVAASMNYGTMSQEHLLMGVAKAGGIGGYALRESKLSIGRLAKGIVRTKEGGDQAMREVLASQNISLEQLKMARDWFERGGRRPEKFDESIKQALESSVAIADAQKSPAVETEHLVLAIMNEPTELLVKAMRRYGVKPKKVISEVEKISDEGLKAFKKRKQKDAKKTKEKDKIKKKEGRVAAAMKAVKTK